MMNILNIIAPIFLIIATGYFAVRLNIVGPKQTQGMGIYVLNIALPTLIFHAIAPTSFDHIFLPGYLLAYALGSGLAFAIGMMVTKLVWRQDKVSAAINGMGLSFSNSGFIGYSVLAMVAGSPRAVMYLSMNILVENFLIIPVLLIFAELGGQSSHSIRSLLWHIIKTLSKSPLILSLAISVIFSVFSIPVPQMLLKTSEMFASSAAPVALFVIGGSLYGLRIGGNIQIVSFIALGKLIIHPLFVLLIFTFIPNAVIEDKLAATLFASVSTGATLAILGQRYGYLKRTSAIVIVSTIFSFFSMGAVLLAWKLLIGF